MIKAPRLIILILSITGLLFSTEGKTQVFKESEDPRATYQKFESLLQLIDYAYVEDVDDAKIVEDAVINVLKELDPHSTYISKKDIDRTNEPLVGNFDGVGIQFQLYHDTILVVSPVPGGPSDKLGILAGDKIIKINGEEAFGSKINNQYVLDHLRGPKGTKVKVDIFRKGTKGLIEYTIVRDKIPLNSIDATYMVNSEIGYVKLARFARTSADEFRESIVQLRKEGMKNLILDLRNNSGGYLDIAFELSDEFLPSGKLIVYTKGLRSPKQDFMATGKGSFENGKLIILIDEASASASEIVSGAVQDWDRGIILGRRSFGKGLVQRPFLLPDSSMIRLTTARYYTPSGRCIQKSYETGSEDYFSEVFTRFEHGEMIHADSIKFPDSLRYYTHNQRVVYGGGGIMPDVFIALDTTFASKYYTDVFRKGLLNEFVLQYVEGTRNELLKTYPNIKVFNSGFNDAKLLDEFVEYAQTKEVPKDEKGLEASGKQISIVLKGLIARNLYNVSAYFEVIGSSDDDIIKAVEILKNEDMFKKLTLAR
ncbi:MAG: S41 family peptidase [Bacteroidales bacterium]|nr:S41 family peptidase [Bacteroidales bacterium]